MPLHVHHAHRAELLVEGLAEVLQAPPADPFAREIVAVPSRGIERWVAQRLSHVLGASASRQDGVAANVDFPFPGAVLAAAVSRASGVDPDADPWQPDRLVWPLLDVVTEAVDRGRTEVLGPLAVHVTPRDGRPSDRRLASVRRVAELFDRYAVHRPAMLRAWAAGQDTDPRGAGTLPPRSRWQPHLWRAVRERLAVASGPERLAEATAALAEGRTVTGDTLELALPDRLAVFGLTSLSATTIEVLAALAAGPGPAGAPREVHLFLRHASPALWRRAAAVLAEVAHDPHGRVAATTTTALPTREADPTAGLARDPLLAAWARDSRELQIVASSVTATWVDRTGLDADTDRDRLPPPPTDATLLERLQEAVAHDRPREVTDALPTLAADDRSVQVHRCHGPARQVEVLRDLVLHLLAEDERLEPRDVLVQCPDIETYAPLIEAVFDPHRARDATTGLHVQLADRSLTRTNPLLRVLAEVLDLADGRITASAVLDLCTREPVRRRFALDEDDLGTLEGWLTSTGIRWGLDADHRADHDVPTDANTWRAGIDRLLAGVAAADERLRTVVGVVPEDEVEGDHVELAGRFVELLTRLQGVVATLATPRPIGAWLDLLRRDVVDQLCAPDPDAAWQELGVDRTLTELRDAVRHAGTDTGHLPLTLAEVRDLLADRLAGAPSRAAHRTGDLTVCTLVPMRSVPHEVVIWLGMDDEVFPRRTVPDGDDLLAAAPLVGDRDPRTEDRQLLLDALLAARRRLVVLTTGNDERTGDRRPPAVPIGELLDAVDRTVSLAAPADRPDPGAHDGEARDGGARDPDAPRTPSQAITTDHPLQGFDARRFTPGALGPAGYPPVPPDEPFGFDADDLEAATAIVGVRTPPRPFLDAPLTPLDEAGRTALADLVAFFQHPVEALLTQRLDVRYPRDGDARSDAIPVEIGGLAGWAPGNRLLEHVVAGRDPDRWLEVERGRGTLPPGDLADGVIDEVRTTVDELVRFAAEHGVPLGTGTRAHGIDLELDGGRRLVGSVNVVGDTRRAVRYSRLGRKHRLAAWIELLALIAQEPERPWQAVTLGRGRNDGTTGSPKPSASVSLLTAGRAATTRHGRRSATVDNSLGDASAPPEERGRRAREELVTLLELRERGLCGPLLLPCETAGAYAETAWKKRWKVSTAAPYNVAKGKWTIDSFAGFSGEDRDHAHVTVLGELDIDELLGFPPHPEEEGPGWSDDTSRLGRLGARVWEPLLGAEEIIDTWADR